MPASFSYGKTFTVNSLSLTVYCDIACLISLALWVRLIECLIKLITLIWESSVTKQFFHVNNILLIFNCHSFVSVMSSTVISEFLNHASITISFFIINALLWSRLFVMNLLSTLKLNDKWVTPSHQPALYSDIISLIYINFPLFAASSFTWLIIICVTCDSWSSEFWCLLFQTAVSFIHGIYNESSISSRQKGYSHWMSTHLIRLNCCSSDLLWAVRAR